MDTLTLDNIDSHFTPELMALMGEWFTYDVFWRENGRCDEEVPTLRGFFETGRIYYGAFTDTLIEYGSPTGRRRVYLDSFFKGYGVIRRRDDDNCTYLEAIVGYDDVRSTFRENLASGKTPIFPCFAWYLRLYLPKTEFVTFSCDPACRPLIEAFCAEGYMAQKGETFHWTPKIRVMMEILGYWEREQELDEQAKYAEEAQRGMSILDQLYQEAFEESLEEEDLTPLINFVKEYPKVISFGASQELERLGIASVIPIIGIIMLLNGFGLSVNPDTVAEDFSEHGEAIKTLRRGEFEKIVELFWPKRIDLNAKRDEPSKEYKLAWRGDPV